MLLSIIVPVFDTEAYLARCLDSLLAQDIEPGDYEIIVVDDGTPDGSLAIAEAYAAIHPNIVIHSQPNQGLSVARNTGLDLARGRFVYFVDSDDYIAAHTLGPIVAMMVREDVQVATFQWVRVTPDQVVADPSPPIVTPARVMTGVEYLADHPYSVGVWVYIYERAFLQGIGIRFEPGRIVEDLIFTSAAVSAATRLVALPVSVYRYVKRKGSIMDMRGAAHTMRVTADWERAITGLDELRRMWLARGTAPGAFIDRLAAQEQTYVFFLIARFIRSDTPLSPTLWAVLSRFEALGMYPMRRFPAVEYRGARYRVLTFIFNRRYLLRPFAAAVRVGARVMRLLRW